MDGFTNSVVEIITPSIPTYFVSSVLLQTSASLILPHGALPRLTMYDIFASKGIVRA